MGCNAEKFERWLGKYKTCYGAVGYGAENLLWVCWKAATVSERSSWASKSKESTEKADNKQSTPCKHENVTPVKSTGVYHCNDCGTYID